MPPRSVARRLSLPAAGCGAGAERGPSGVSGWSVLAAALLRDSLARCVCGQYGTFTWLLPLCFFFFLLLCF